MSFQNIKPGDKVWFTTAQGVHLCGKAQALLIFPDHVVVSLGGRYGRPAVVNASNFAGTGGRHPSLRRKA